MEEATIRFKAEATVDCNVLIVDDGISVIDLVDKLKSGEYVITLNPEVDDDFSYSVVTKDNDEVGNDVVVAMVFDPVFNDEKFTDFMLLRGTF